VKKCKGLKKKKERIEPGESLSSKASKTLKK
jgi:hypothetical protein